MNRKAYHCPYCGVYAEQAWSQLIYEASMTLQPSHIYRGECFNCHQLTYWFFGRTDGTTEEQPTAMMVIPSRSGSAPTPSPDFPEDAKGDYEEARGIVDRSPRGAMALLRLALQKLCADLGESGKNINADIASLVEKKGLAPRVQGALDSLRVIGNNAVHPGQLDLKDDKETAIAMFGLLNFIVEQMISRPKELDAIYATLPSSALEAIEQRDAPKELDPGPT